jgi:hypothetical protein
VRLSAVLYSRFLLGKVRVTDTDEAALIVGQEGIFLPEGFADFPAIFDDAFRSLELFDDMSSSFAVAQQHLRP